MTSDPTGPLRTEDLAYLAGYFDGEGTIGITGGSLCVRVVNTHRPAVDRFAALFGGAVGLHQAGNTATRPQWIWRAYGDTAAAFLTAVLPLLHEKAPQAYLGLQYRLVKSREDRSHLRTALSMLKRSSHYR